MKSENQVKHSEVAIYDSGYRNSDVIPDQDLMALIQRDCNVWLEDKLSGYATGAKALVLGCGGGHDAINLARRGFEVVGIDLSPVRIQAARRRADSQGYHSIVFEV